MKVLLKFLFLLAISLSVINDKVKAQEECGASITPEQVDYIYDTHQEFNNMGFDLSDFETTTFFCVAHIVRDELGNGGLSNQDLTLSFQQLNKHFETVGFVFEICDINFIDDKEQYNKVSGRTLLNYNYENTINIFFAPNIGGFCGWASLPSSANDWVVMDNDCATNGSTLAHELGHYFSLYHTHRGERENFTDELVSRKSSGKNCGKKGVGDELCDTPAEPNYNGKISESGKKYQGQNNCVNGSCKYNCGGTDSKNEQYKPDTGNIMSYSSAACRKSFTDDQTNRMQQSAMMHRSYLNSSCSPKTVNEQDSLALIAFYKATNGQNWKNKWDLTKPVSKWNGVTLNNKGRVISLIFESNNLDGYLPKEIGDLSSMETLYLWGNSLLKGEIPLEIGKLLQLKYLEISSTGVGGSIPIEISKLGKLETLKIWNNKRLKGTIPPQIKEMKNLKTLQMHLNGLSGNFPPELASLPKLKFLSLSGLSSCYDPALKVLCDQLPRFNSSISDRSNFDADWTDFCDTGAGMCTCDRKTDSLSLMTLYNGLAGANWKPDNKKWNLNEPIDMWNGVTLNKDGCVQELQLPYTIVKGKLPSELGNLYYLKNLSVGNNGSELSGNIPNEIGKLYNLETLKFGGSNKSKGFEGSIPKEIANLSRLKYMDISGHDFTGNVPTEVGYLKNLEMLFISNSNYKGEIPLEIASLSKLKYLALAFNELSGCFKPEFGELCNQLVSGIFYGNNFEATWEDFCNFGAGTCNATFKNGDFNNDGVVNHIDGLYLGLAYGNTGPNCKASDVNIDACEDWNVEINGVNGKYQDADRNGLIDEADLGALAANYSYNSTNVTNLNASGDEFTIESVHVDGKTLTFDLFLESANQQNIVTHGIACSVDLSDFDLSSVEVNFSNSCIAPDITFYQLNPTTNILDIVVSRKDKTNKTCNAAVARVLITSIKEFETDDDNQVSLLNGNTINANGMHLNVDGNTYDVGQGGIIKLANTNQKNTPDLIQNYPNPFKEVTTIAYELPKTYQQAFIKVYDITGQMIKSVSLNTTGKGTIDLKAIDIQSGLYLYTLEVDGRALSTKKMRIE